MLNYEMITRLIDSGASVLDLGCGDGTLLKMLKEKKQVKGVGVEINQDMVIAALENGCSVIQGDIDEGLTHFSDNSFDFCILGQTLQSTEKPDFVIEEMLRVAKKSIVSFPNFAHWRVRFYLLLKGKMPKSKALPWEWYNTPNIHLLTIHDFFEFCAARNIKILNYKSGGFMRFFNNLFAEEVVFAITKQD